jgi:plasmid maintenance system killer protein
MELVFSERFDRSLRLAPPPVQRAFWKQAGFLLANLHHPSLRAKKYEGADDLWQARVNRDWRFYFRIIGNRYFLVDITAHPK